MENEREAKLKEEQKYQDEPYKTKEEEKKNFEQQYEEIKEKIIKMNEKINDENVDKVTEEEQMLKYTKIMEEMTNFSENIMDSENRQGDVDIANEELEEANKLYSKYQKDKDAFYKKRETKQGNRSRGGVKKESHVWDEDSDK